MHMPTFEWIYYTIHKEQVFLLSSSAKTPNTDNKDIKCDENKDISYLESEKAASLLAEELNMPCYSLSYQ